MSDATPEPGDLVLVPFPFADLTTSKRRPGLVLRHIHSPHLPDLLLLAMVTSRTDQPELTGDVPVREWESAGLLRSSLVRLAKLVTLEGSMAQRRLGALASSDYERVSTTLRELLAPWWA